MNVAFIPVRGGSKSIPLKNIRILNGKPLVYWTVAAACSCSRIDVVYVATDSEDIRKTVNNFCLKDKKLFHNVRVIDRSAESASDTASTESAMLEFAGKYDFDNIVLIQATSPLLKGRDLERGFAVYDEEDTDSVMSAVPQKRFIWNIGSDGFASAQNYDVYNRPRRQDFECYYVENGAFYICSKQDLLRTKNRVSGNIKIVPMDEETFYEIDEPSDWTVIEALMKKQDTAKKNNGQNSTDEKLQSPFGESVDKAIDKLKATCKYKMLLTDCDGTLTDGGMYYSEKADELKKYNTRDGVAIGILREAGIITGMITGEDVELNRRRCKKLKMDVYAPGCRNKAECVERLCREYDMDPSEVIYVGDDINDVDAIKMAGLGCCPSDACLQARKSADHVTKAIGGGGVIREIVEGLISGGIL